MIRALLSFLITIFIVSPAFAGAAYEARGGAVRIVVYSEACALKEITNLPKRATWHEGEKVYEGCVGLADGLAIFYFADKTVVVVPAQVFVRVTGV